MSWAVPRPGRIRPLRYPQRASGRLGCPAAARLRRPPCVQAPARPRLMSTQTDSRPARDVHVRPGLPAMPRATVLGTPLALTDYEGAMDWMDEVVRRRERACVTAAAVHLVMVAREDAATRAAVDGALAVPDGVPLVWALRALGHPQASRVYGPDLMAAYCERSARTGTTMYLYGGRSDAALEQLTAALVQRYPGLRIVGGWSPPFRPLTDAERDEVAERINATGAD